MAERRAHRKWGFRVAASVCAVFTAPACAFWSLGDLDAHANDAADASFDGAAIDASTDDASDAGPRFGGSSFCSDASASALFCDDFDSDAATWTTSFTCIACSQTVATPDGGGAPSPPNALFVEAPAKEANPSSFRTETLLGAHDSVTSSFWGYIDESDSNGQPAFEELADQIDDANYVRLRVYVYAGKLDVGTSVTSSKLAGPTYDDSFRIDAPFGRWFHVVYNLTTTGTAWTYSCSIDGQVLIAAQPLPNGDALVGHPSRVDLRAGIFYIGPQPANGDTRFRLDDVLVTSP